MNYKMTEKDNPFERGYSQASYGWYPCAGHKETDPKYKKLFYEGVSQYYKDKNKKSSGALRF